MKKVKLLSLILVIAIISTVCFTFVGCDKEETRDDVFASDTVFGVNFKKTDIAAGMLKGGALDVLAKMALDVDQSYFVFKADGTCHGQLATTKKLALIDLVDNLMSSLGGGESEGGTNNPNAAATESISLEDGGSIETFLQMYAEPFFPGFKKALKNEGPKAVAELLKRGLGISIEAYYWDDNDKVKSDANRKNVFENETFLEGIALICEDDDNYCLPANVLSYIPGNTQLILTFDEPYNIQTLKNYKGEEVKAIFVGQTVKDNPYTQPFGVFTLTTDEDGLMNASLAIEVVATTITLTQRA